MCSTSILHGDCLTHLRDLRSASFDALITDPPYEIGITAWDSSGVAFRVELWSEALRVLKPGGHLLAFGSTRTYHRMAAAIEDSGFEIRDSLHWIYSNGFPKGIDVSKAIDRRRYDRDAVLVVTQFVREARNRSHRTNAEIDAHIGVRGMASHWTSRSQPAIPSLAQWQKLKGFLGFDDSMDAEVTRLCERKGKLGEAWEQRTVTGQYDEPAAANGWAVRMGEKSRLRVRERRDSGATELSQEWQGWGTTLKPAHEPIVMARKAVDGSVADNVLRYRTGAMNLAACRIGDEKTGSRLPTNVIFDPVAAAELDAQAPPSKRGEHPFSRFFYVAKPTPAERGAGLPANAPHHPTMKPVMLMRYLVRLVTASGGTILDPFAGSGTTGVAAVLEGANFVGIEREAEYVAVAEARIAHWKGERHERSAA